MAKSQGHKSADMVSDMVDDVPAKAPVAITAAALPAGPPAQAPVPEPAPEQPPADADDDSNPWGYLIKHPGYGALRVRKEEARTEAEAIEVYRRKRCPHLKLVQLEETGLRANVRRFVPAETERGE